LVRFPADACTRKRRPCLVLLAWENSVEFACDRQETDFRELEGIRMKYMITWSERPQGSPIEYENAQKRILEVFTQWKAPANFNIELFVIRVGDWGGYMMLDCDDPLAVHKFCSMLPAFEFEARPVVPVMDAVRVELEAIAFRDGLKGK
jgi:hypothetical protein